MRFVLGCLTLLMLASISAADSVDAAEALRRGVPVQQVQLENELKKEAVLNEQIAALKKQVADLQMQVTKAKADAQKDVEVATKAWKDQAAQWMKERDEARQEAEKAKADLAVANAALTPAQRKKIEDDTAKVKAREEAIATALKNHQIVNGMTLAEAGMAVGDGSPKMVSQAGEVSTYQLAHFEIVGTVRSITYFFVDIRNDRVVSWSRGANVQQATGVPAEGRP